ncbi:MAG: hypothetical protein FWE18_04550 [Alphaproteobacteria bacterium]|nr:hypothetical protein [Alphaproteobacteria bacterium]
MKTLLLAMLLLIAFIPIIKSNANQSQRITIISKHYLHVKNPLAAPLQEEMNRRYIKTNNCNYIEELNTIMCSAKLRPVITQARKPGYPMTRPIH